jgi:putative transcriptional regulator
MKEQLFNELMESVTQGGKILPSREFDLSSPDVKSIREKYGLSQVKFAKLLGISPATLRNWEQGRRKPEGAARILLLIADKHPEAVLETVHSL